MKDFLISFISNHPIIYDIIAFLYSLFHSKSYLVECLSKKIRVSGAFISDTRIHIAGDSRVDIGRKARLRHCKIDINGNHCHVTINGYRSSMNNMKIYVIDDNSNVTIDEGFTIEGGCITVIEGTSINIGRDCMFSGGVDLSSGDMHAIVNSNNENERLNWSKSITIGSHVWIGAHVKVLKGVTIASNTIIGNSSLVSKSLLQENCIYAGVPAKEVKIGINWHRDRLQYKKK